MSDLIPKGQSILVGIDIVGLVAGCDRFTVGVPIQN